MLDGDGEELVDVIHISGFGRFRARTVLFSVAWIAFIAFAVVVLKHAL